MKRSLGSGTKAKARFTLVADGVQPEQKRWVLVAPPGAGDTAATPLLAWAVTTEQAAFIGNQAGGRVFLFHKRSA